MLIKPVIYEDTACGVLLDRRHCQFCLLNETKLIRSRTVANVVGFLEFTLSESKDEPTKRRGLQE